jgi:hypothetical protein
MYIYRQREQFIVFSTAQDCNMCWSVREYSGINKFLNFDICVVQN